MTVADQAEIALGITAAFAVVARWRGALTTGGTVAGAVVGACVSVGFGLPGLAVLGTFFVVGTLATRIGWEKKKARGTAEAGEGRRDWKRVIGKGGVAAAAALLFALDRSWALRGAFVGAVAAALADTLGTEIGTLSGGDARSLPLLRRVPAGTPGAVSLLGTTGVVLGAVLVACVAVSSTAFSPERPAAFNGVLAAASGIAASFAESLAVGLGWRAPGFVRNVGTTLVGALLAAPLWLSVLC